MVSEVEHGQTLPSGLETGHDCEAVRALIPAYCLGATNPDETAFVQANLARCPEAAAELADYSRMVEALHYSAPPARPPAALLESLLAAAGTHNLESGAAVPMQRRPASIVRLPRLRVYLAAAVVAVVTVLMAVPLILSTLYWHGEIDRLNAEHAATLIRVTEQARALALVGSRGARRIDLPAAANGQIAPGARPAAVVICDPAQSWGVLHVVNFPALAADRVYQLWLTRGSERVSGGLFRVDESGTTTFVFDAPEPMGQFELLGITPEPAGGSPGPTAPPVVRGSLNYDQAW